VLSNTNEEPSRKRLHNVNRKLKQNQQLKDEYEKIVHEQLKDGVIEKTKESSTSEHVFYMPHRPVIKENASTTKTGSDIADLEDFKREATEILENAKFPVHKWESNVEELDNKSNPSKILGHKWNKREDTLEIRAEPTKEETPVTKRHILKELSSIYDPLGIISPTMVEGKRIYREACDEKVGWNSEVSTSTSKDWIKWRQQLRNVKIPRTKSSKGDSKGESYTFAFIC
ncbi:Hypothetical predicted protein, partial [Paramuricea clavata]